MLFRSICARGHVLARRLSPGQIAETVRRVSKGNLRTHDMRRTNARLAYDGGATVEQIQLHLGHASAETTRKYLGLLQDFRNAPCDRFDLRIGPSSARDVSGVPSKPAERRKAK